jgi:hypothetical protein
MGGRECYPRGNQRPRGVSDNNQPGCGVCFGTIPCREHPAPPKLSFAGGRHFEPSHNYKKAETIEPQVQDSSRPDDRQAGCDDGGWPARDSLVASAAGEEPPEGRQGIQPDRVIPGPVPLQVIDAYNRLLDRHICNYPVESIAAGGEFQRGMLSGLLTAAEELVEPPAADADARVIAARELLSRMARELNPPAPRDQENVVSITPNTQDPPSSALNKSAIELVEGLLARARSGELIDVAFVEVCANNAVQTAWSRGGNYFKLSSGSLSLACRLGMLD